MNEKLVAMMAERKLLEKQKNSILNKKKSKDEVQLNLKKVLSIFISVTEETQQKFSRNLSSLVTSCLGIVFVEDEYSFDVIFDSSSTKTNVEFVLFKNGNPQDILTATGGGVCDIVAIALRLALHQMMKPKSRNTLIIDEGFKCLRGVDNLVRVYEMLDVMSKELNLQIIMINNANENLELVEKYNVIVLENKDGVSIFK